MGMLECIAGIEHMGHLAGTNEYTGIPLRYLSVNKPCANGEKAMHPTLF
jgi:hypothetical protein